MNCPHCGVNVGPATEFCPSCLGSLQAQTPRTDGNAAFAPAPEPVPVVAPPPETPLVIENPCPDHPDRPIGGTCARCGKFICVRCVPDLTTTSKPQCPSCVARESAKTLVGLGGWLILPIIHFFVLPFWALTALAGYIVLTTKRFPLPAGARVIAGRETEFLLEVVALFGLAALAVTALVYIFRKKKQAPRFAIAVYVAAVLMPILSGASVGGIVRSLLFSVLWIAYFLNSKRVANTFVN